MREIRLGDTIDVKFCTVNGSGVPTQLAGSPVVSAYPGNSTTQVTGGITLSVDFDSVTGLNNVRVVASSGNGYAVNTEYSLVITTGTVNGNSVVGYVVGEFVIERADGVLAMLKDIITGSGAGTRELTAKKLLLSNSSGVCFEVIVGGSNPGVFFKAGGTGQQAGLYCEGGAAGGAGIIGFAKADDAGIIGQGHGIGNGIEGKGGVSGAGMWLTGGIDTSDDPTGNGHGLVINGVGTGTGLLVTGEEADGALLAGGTSNSSAGGVASGLRTLSQASGGVGIQSDGGINGDINGSGIVVGVVTTGGTTTSVPTSSLSPAAAVDNQFKDRIIIFNKTTTTANLRGQAAQITASTAGGTLTVTTLTTAPVSGDTFRIY